MEARELLRVVTLRKGKVKPVEFRLRQGERGLSLFACLDDPSPADVVRAVQAVGKQGELGAAVIPAHAIHALGLTLVQTPGGTSVAEVDAVHFEARLPFLRGVFLRLRGLRIPEYFNDRFSQKLFEAARLRD